MCPYPPMTAHSPHCQCCPPELQAGSHRLKDFKEVKERREKEKSSSVCHRSASKLQPTKGMFQYTINLR